MWRGFMWCNITRSLLKINCIRLHDFCCIFTILILHYGPCNTHSCRITKRFSHFVPYPHFSSHLVPLHFNTQPSSSLTLVLQEFLFPSMAVTSVCWLVAVETRSQHPWQTSELLVWGMTPARIELQRIRCFHVITQFDSLTSATNEKHTRFITRTRNLTTEQKSTECTAETNINPDRCCSQKNRYLLY